MKAYTAFIIKEILESLRTYKLYIMGAAFLILGMMNPLIAKLLPDLLKSALPELAGIVGTETTALDSWDQFFKNIGQLGMLTLVITYSGSMADELNRGTLINVLTKGLKRSTVILAKFVTITAIWTISYLLCFAVTYAYTAYFWGLESMRQSMSNSFLTFSGMWLYGVFLIVLLIFGGVLFKNIYNLLFTGITVIIMMLLNIIPGLHKFNPITLASNNLLLLKSQSSVYDFMHASSICIGIILGLIIMSISLFNKKQI